MTEHTVSSQPTERTYDQVVDALVDEGHDREDATDVVAAIVATHEEGELTVDGVEQTARTELAGSAMETRLAEAGYARDPHGMWVRVDDVYETRVTRDDPGLWLVGCYNSEVEDEEAGTVRFRIRDNGEVYDTDGRIDHATATMIANDLTPPEG